MIRKFLIKNILKNIYLLIRSILLKWLAPIIIKFSHQNDNFGQDIKKVLFIRIDRIGDLVLSTPALKALKQFFPSAKIAVLASKSNYQVIQNNPNVDDIYIFDQKDRIGCKLSVIKKIRQKKFDLVIDPLPGYELKTALVALLTGAKLRIGYSGFGREYLFTAKVPLPQNGKSFTDLTLDVLKPLGIMDSNNLPEIHINQSENELATNWLEAKCRDNNAIVGMHPGAYYPSQRWPSDYFAELVDLLVAHKNVNLILFGGSKDRKLVKQIQEKAKSEILVNVSDDLRFFISLLSKCNVIVCNNSGPLHLATGLNIPSVSFMGPTDKERWMPIGNRHMVFRNDDLFCIGCNLGRCKIKTHDCMRLTTPSMVYDSISNLL